MRILIVDDQMVNRKLLRAQLEGEQHEVVEASDGIEALRLLEAEAVEAIISDVLMPNMDGFRLCREVRSHEKTAGLPFIIYTNTYDSPSDRQLGQNVGADNYLVRPVATTILIEAVGKALENRHQRKPPTITNDKGYIIQQYNAALVTKLEQKNVELAETNKELVQVRNRLRQLLDHSPAVIYSLKVEDGHAIPVFISENVTRVLGFKVEEIFGCEQWLKHVHPDDRIWAVPGISKIHKSGTLTTQYRMRHKEGHYLWVENTRRAICDASGGLVEIAGVWTDITQRKQNEERLREQAELLDIASDAILVEDLEGRIQYWSKGAERMFGWNAGEAVGRRTTEFLDRDDSSLWQIRQTLLKHGEWSGEARKHTKAGEEAIVQTRWTLLRDDDARPRAILSINTDITEKKKLEAQFFRTQRLESIGTLASGIAHDLNNVLAPIILSLALLAEKAADQESKRLLQSLQQNARRGSDIISQVLAFGRGVRGERVLVVPKHLLRELEGIVKETFPKTIRLEVKTDPNLWNITGDPTQLHQVLLNLCINARDAMPQGGRLSLTAGNIVLDENHTDLRPARPSGKYVLFEVADTGVGIPPDIRDRIFEPFFTTKEMGRGTGLGLSTVTAILKGHEGYISIHSEANKGSLFKVYLPATPVRAKDDSSHLPAELPRGNGECVLLVDDEELIIDVTRKALERFGYRVLTAMNGAEAVALYTQNHGEIAVVLTDMLMPVMDGAATIHALHKIDPQARIIAASGFGSESGMARAVEAGVKHHLQKPYTTDTLLRLLSQLIHESKESTRASGEVESADASSSD